MIKWCTAQRNIFDLYQRRFDLGRQKKLKLSNALLRRKKKLGDSGAGGLMRSAGGNARAGFRITIFDNRTRGDNWKPRLERVVVVGE